MKKHWTKKLKEENEKLKADIYKVLDGDFETILIYKTQRDMAKNLEKLVWGH